MYRAASFFRGGRAKLAQTVAIQVEVSFITLYKDQPALGHIDLELRAQGFVHSFLACLMVHSGTTFDRSLVMTSPPSNFRGPIWATVAWANTGNRGS
jgi:hypothetical protein